MPNGKFGCSERREFFDKGLYAWLAPEILSAGSRNLPAEPFHRSIRPGPVGPKEGSRVIGGDGV